MPTDQPSNAPDAIGTDARDRDTAAGVLHDAAPELNPGGGGLTGSAVPPPLEVEGGAPRGPTRNSPIDPGTPPTDADGLTEAEARHLAGQDGAAEPHPRSQ
jgi:hypothetical protein